MGETRLYPMDWNSEGIRLLLQQMHIKQEEQIMRAKRGVSKSAVIRRECKEKFEHSLKNQKHRKSYLTLDDPTKFVFKPGQMPIKKDSLAKAGLLFGDTSADNISSATDNEVSIRRLIESYNKKYRVQSANGEVFDCRKVILVDNETEYKEVFNKDSGRNACTQIRISKTSLEKLNVLMSNDPVDLLGTGNDKDTEESARSFGHIKPIISNEKNLHRGKSPAFEEDAHASRSHDDRQVVVKHWIDDLTVSSEEPLCTQPPANLVESKPLSSVKQLKEETNPVAQPPPVIEATHPTATIEEPQLHVPGFICPSSEKKSKDYAVRLWLTNCDFITANKTIPLL